LGFSRVITLSLNSPLNVNLTFEVTPPAYPTVFEDNRLYRAFKIDDKLVPTIVKFEGDVNNPVAKIEVLSKVARKELYRIVKLVRRHVCDELDLSKVYEAMGRNFQWLSKELYGLKPWIAPTPFEGVVLSIIFQQLSTRAALSIIRSFVERTGEYLDVEGIRFYSFPTPEELASMSIESLRKCKLSLNKAIYIKTFSREVLKGLDLDRLEVYPTSEIYDILTSIKGIGRWTARLALLIAFERWESLPSDDLGIRKAFAKLIFGKEMASAQEVEEYAERWGAYKGPIAYYLLVYYEKHLKR